LDNSIEYIDDLIGKYLAGEASGEETAIVEAWAKESDDNKKYLDQFRVIFDRAATVTSIHQYDTDAAWNKVKANLKKPEGKIVSFDAPRTNRSLFWSIAASIIIVLGIGFFLLRPNTSASTYQPVEVIAQDKAVSDTLPNGSDIFLNKKSKLSYKFDKASKTHEVKLKGEAYFNVKHSKRETFIIDIEGIYIKDIGTSFNVKAYPESNTVEVLVEEGEVVFFTKNDSGIHLRASGKGVYDKVTKEFTIEEPEPNVLAYKTKFFIFSSTDLQTVVQTLNHVYDKKIVLADNLKKCQLTVSFKDEQIDEIAQVIAETLGLTLRAENETLILEGPGCE
jgi:transmembrane sensor